ncbi:hypothetical protein CAOG_03278 [Capsaspora owczarzaki ATCC 30864]|uniref:F-box domain-containing protein n=1 Tax=Capsaspora owczarzaki (strain ATCC 30864) TaxID=595528 RepID=A0A0D2UB49_CAPO3|nr:hypothetical protein CAOG_03278 [Capsaspora owczarzaki ATCC 30864]KJE92276.1 hypothetical protein CAOG_003278 [Capsaspora owczarzaki ATCC 30864]|eukprot:XP_004364117.2 hypothetical protein CAOG_03278 [Capsaspora owczarzaki ATCC 30864]
MTTTPINAIEVLTQLPSDIQSTVLSFLSPSDLQQLRLSSRGLSKLVDETSTLWVSRYTASYGNVNEYIAILNNNLGFELPAFVPQGGWKGAFIERQIQQQDSRATDLVAVDARSALTRSERPAGSSDGASTSAQASASTAATAGTAGAAGKSAAAEDETTQVITLHANPASSSMLVANAEIAQPRLHSRCLSKQKGFCANVKRTPAISSQSSTRLLQISCACWNSFRNMHRRSIFSRVHPAMRFIEFCEEVDADFEPVRELKKQVLSLIEKQTETDDHVALIVDDYLSEDLQEVLTRIFARFDRDGDHAWNRQELDSFVFATNQQHVTDQFWRAIRQNFTCNARGHLLQEGLFEFYLRQTLDDPEETWKDMRTHGFDSFLRSDETARSA